MLLNSPAMMRTHSCPTSAPIGWNARKPGMICSDISMLAWVSRDPRVGRA